MQIHWILLTVFILLNVPTSVQGLFSGSSIQDYVDSIVDAASFRLNGMLSLNDSVLNRMWSYFKSKYGRVYSSLEEEKERFRIFRDHLKYVLETNLERLRSFQLELNEFADWTIEEFNAVKKGLVLSDTLQRRIFHDDSNSNDDSLRRSLKRLNQQHHQARRMKRSMHSRRNHHFYDKKRGFRDWLWSLVNSGGSGETSNSFDWRTKKVVSSVKNQLNCGCCYAFATAAVLETLYALKSKSTNVIELSPQQITDCSNNGNNGCSGGNFSPSLRYILGQGGRVATLASYPYAGKKEACKTNGINQINLGNIEYGAIPEGNEKAMAEALVNYGPLFIGLDADSRLFMFYKSGVLSIAGCPTRRQDMDHAMVTVGYGYDNALKMSYWTIKNSWGDKWGENGYIRLAKDKGNMCGISSMAYYAKLT